MAATQHRGGRAWPPPPPLLPPPPPLPHTHWHPSSLFPVLFSYMHSLYETGRCLLIFFFFTPVHLSFPSLLRRLFCSLDGVFTHFPFSCWFHAGTEYTDRCWPWNIYSVNYSLDSSACELSHHVFYLLMMILFSFDFVFSVVLTWIFHFYFGGGGGGVYLFPCKTVADDERWGPETASSGLFSSHKSSSEIHLYLPFDGDDWPFKDTRAVCWDGARSVWAGAVIQDPPTALTHK